MVFIPNEIILQNCDFFSMNLLWLQLKSATSIWCQTASTLPSALGVGSETLVRSSVSGVNQWGAKKMWCPGQRQIATDAHAQQEELGLKPDMVALLTRFYEEGRFRTQPVALLGWEESSLPYCPSGSLSFARSVIYPWKMSLENGFYSRLTTSALTRQETWKMSCKSKQSK